MNEERLAYFKQKLEGLHRAERNSAGAIRDGLRVPLRESAQELSLYDNHPGDVSNATFERELDLGLMIDADNRLSMVEDALRAIDSGTYGICRSCGREIDPERLEAVPYALLCLECKQKLESDRI